MRQQIKDWCQAHPHLISFVSFILFFVWLKSLLGWPVAFMLATSFVIHEYSHVWVMKRIGMRIKGVIFIPFLGAVALGGGIKILTRKQECLIAMAGPLMGYLSALPVFIAFAITGNPLFGTAFTYIVLLNLFNMLPLSPLDGGRIIKSIFMSFKNRMTGFLVWGAIGAASSYYLMRMNISIIIFALVIFVAVQEFMNEWRLHRVRQRAEKILLRYEGLSKAEREARLREEYYENIEIVETAREMSKAMEPLTLKSGIVFSLVYIILAGWPFLM